MYAITVRDLTFRWPGDGRLALSDLTLDIERGARCLLVGANGAGKSTLLEVLAGRHMVSEGAVHVLGRDAFADTSLVRQVTYLGGEFPFDVDIRVCDVIAGRRDADPARMQALVSLLGVDPEWHMHRVSAGQRRRVQLLLGLVQRSDVLLLDEVTTDLDVLARTDLLAFLREETESRGATIVYATHIFDALDTWATHLVWLDRGRARLYDRLEHIGDLEERRARSEPTPLLRTVQAWLREASATLR